MWVYGWSGQIALIKWGRWLLDTLDRLLQTTALLHMRSIQQYMCRDVDILQKIFQCFGAQVIFLKVGCLSMPCL